HIMRELDAYGVHLHNWQEDVVTPDLIDMLVILDGQVVKPTDGIALASSAFEPRKELCARLKVQLLASVLAHVPTAAANQLAHVTANESDRDARSWLMAEQFLAGTLPASTQTLIREHVWTAKEDEAVAALIAAIMQHEDQRDGVANRGSRVA